MGHLLCREPGHEAVLATFVDWLDARAPAAAAKTKAAAAAARS